MYCKQVIAEVKKLFQFLLAFWLLGELHPGLSGRSEEHDHQASENMGLVRAENFQFPWDLRHRRPHWT